MLRLAHGRAQVHLCRVMQHTPLPIKVGRTRDGAVAYVVDVPPEALPPVLVRDLAAAWDAARDAAADSAWGTARLFRFRRPDGSVTDLVLSDEDARCWAGAVDGTVGMKTSYGLSLCLRLLALVDLMARASWMRSLFRIGRAGTALHPALLAAAATAPLTPDARFDETGFRRRLSGPSGSPSTGALA